MKRIERLLREVGNLCSWNNVRPEDLPAYRGLARRGLVYGPTCRRPGAVAVDRGLVLTPAGHEALARLETSQAAAVLGRAGGAARTEAQAEAARRNGRRGGDPRVEIPDQVQLVNPWSGALPPDRVMTWEELREWAVDNVHERDRAAWLRAARRYYRRRDGAALGRMIIGS